MARTGVRAPQGRVPFYRNAYHNGKGRTHGSAPTGCSAGRRAVPGEWPAQGCGPHREGFRSTGMLTTTEKGGHMGPPLQGVLREKGRPGGTGRRGRRPLLTAGLAAAKTGEQALRRPPKLPLKLRRGLETCVKRPRHALRVRGNGPVRGPGPTRWPTDRRF